jgi:hypothetical protein
MILKIATGNGWTFIDNVKEVHVEEYLGDRYNKEADAGRRTAYADVFLHYHRLNDDGTIAMDKSKMDQPGKPITDLRDWKYVELLPTFNNGEVKLYVADLAVYLMSEAGKTIERIN